MVCGQLCVTNEMLRLWLGATGSASVGGRVQGPFRVPRDVRVHCQTQCHPAVRSRSDRQHAQEPLDAIWLNPLPMVAPILDVGCLPTQSGGIFVCCCSPRNGHADVRTESLNGVTQRGSPSCYGTVEATVKLGGDVIHTETAFWLQGQCTGRRLAAISTVRRLRMRFLWSPGGLYRLSGCSRIPINHCLSAV